MSDGGNNKNAHQTLPVHQRIDHELFWSVQPCIVTTHTIYFIERSILHPKHSVQAILLLCMEMLIECTTILQITVLFELKKCTTILWICLLDASNILNPLPWKSAHPPHRFSLVKRDRFVELISWCSIKNWFLINQSINLSFFLSTYKTTSVKWNQRTLKTVFRSFEMLYSHITPFTMACHNANIATLQFHSHQQKKTQFSKITK